MKYFDHTKRSIVKSLTFRVMVMISDSIIIYTITHKVEVTVGVILFSNLSSTVLYYIHERLWNKISWGKVK